MTAAKVKTVLESSLKMKNVQIEKLVSIAMHTFTKTITIAEYRVGLPVFPYVPHFVALARIYPFDRNYQLVDQFEVLM